MSGYNAKNYTEQGGEVTHIGGKLIFDDDVSVSGGLLPNQAASTATSVANIKDDFNALLIKLKDAGVMAGDALTVTVSNSVNDSVAGHANRSYNTGKISDVAIGDDNKITITLSEKVSNLKDFDGGNGWGVYKWLGIAVSAGITPITGLYYNGAQLTAEDVTEATTVGLSAGKFVLWVRADEVLKGNYNKFRLRASGYAEIECTLAIVEPEDD